MDTVNFTNPNLSAYSTHLPVLTAMIAVTKGPILELGSGLYSTPIIAAMAAAQKREFVTIETEKDWMDVMLPLKGNDQHQFLYVEGHDFPIWVEIERSSDRYWGLIFIDHGIFGNHNHWSRGITLEKLRKKADYLVIHDSEPDHREWYGLNDILKFPHVREYRKLFPQSIVVSDFHPIPEFE